VEPRKEEDRWAHFVGRNFQGSFVASLRLLPFSLSPSALSGVLTTTDRSFLTSAVYHKYRQIFTATFLEIVLCSHFMQLSFPIVRLTSTSTTLTSNLTS